MSPCCQLAALFIHAGLCGRIRKVSMLALFCPVISPKQHWAGWWGYQATPCHPWESWKFNLPLPLWVWFSLPLSQHVIQSTDNVYQKPEKESFWDSKLTFVNSIPSCISSCVGCFIIYYVQSPMIKGIFIILWEEIQIAQSSPITLTKEINVGGPVKSKQSTSYL